MDDKMFELMEKFYAEFLETRRDIAGIKQDINGLKEDVGGLKEDVGGLKEDVGGLKEDVGGLKEDVGGLKGDVKDLKAGQKKIETKIEHEVSDKIKILFEGHTALHERLDRIENKIDCISEKVEMHDIKIKVIEGGKKRKSL